MRFHKGQRLHAPHPKDGKVCFCTVLDCAEHPQTGETVKLLFDDGVQSDWLDSAVIDVNEYD